MTIGMILLILAIIAFACATFNVSSPVNLVALGLLLLAIRAAVGGGAVL